MIGVELCLKTIIKKRMVYTNDDDDSHSKNCRSIEVNFMCFKCTRCFYRKTCTCYWDGYALQHDVCCEDCVNADSRLQSNRYYHTTLARLQFSTRKCALRCFLTNVR